LLSATPKPVFRDTLVTLLGTPSPDGRMVSLVEQGDLAVRDISTGVSTKLTHATGKQFAYFSAISRDSKSIAYAWFNEEGFYELRMIPVAGGPERTLFKNPEAGFVQPCAWTPDNRHILTLLFRKDNVSQIALIPVAGGEPQVLRSLNWVYPKRMDISPDGKTLIYDSFAPGSTTQRTIYSLSMDGSTERRLVTEAGNHLFPLFAPDGKSFFYLSDDNLVRRSIDGPPQTVHSGLGRALPLGITSAGRLYYGLRTGASDVFLASVDSIASTAKRVSIRYPNRNLAPSFSWNGKRLAYLSRRGTENFGQESRAVVIRELDTDKETEIPVKMAHIERVAWRRDDQGLYLSGSDGRGRGGLFAYDFETGRTRPVVAEIGGPPKGYEFYVVAAGLIYVDGAIVRDEQRSEKGPLSGLGSMLSGRPIDAGGVVEWLPSVKTLFGVRGNRLVRFGEPDEQSYPLPGNRQPGASISPDGLTIAITAGRESQEIWALDVQ